jgi:hypothetical protein
LGAFFALSLSRYRTPSSALQTAMATLNSHTKPPNLAYAFLVLISSSLGTMASYPSQPDMISSWPLMAPMFAITSTAYYGARYSLRPIGPEPGIGEAWPATPLFPGRRERSGYLRFPFIGLALHVICGIYLVTDVLSFFTLCTGVGANVVVTVQAVRVTATEDRVLCEQLGHDIRCQPCGVSKTEITQPRPALERIIHPVVILLFNMVSSALMIGMIHSSLDEGYQVESRLLTFTPACTIIHHASCLFVAMRSAYRRRSDPLSPDSPTLDTAPSYVGGMAATLIWYIAVLGKAHRPPLVICWSHGTLGVAIGLYCISMLVVPSVALFLARNMSRAEATAKCMREGHQWACARLCLSRTDIAKHSSLPTSNAGPGEHECVEMNEVSLPLVSESSRSCYNRSLTVCMRKMALPAM